jgi:hypothetical protein
MLTYICTKRTIQTFITTNYIMFAKINSFTVQCPQKNPRSLTKILNDYKQLADANPHKLRNQIPAYEIRRFFVDGVHMPRENWIDFEKRENGYIRPFHCFLIMIAQQIALSYVSCMVKHLKMLPKQIMRLITES